MALAGPRLAGLLREKVFGENHVSVMGSKGVRLGNMLDFFNKGGGISIWNSSILSI